MGRDRGTGRARAARLLGSPLEEAPGEAAEVSRHAATVEPAPGRWRLTGAPAGAAVTVAAVAVTVSVLALGGGGGEEEVLVGPASGAAATEAVDAGTGAVVTGAARTGAGETGAVEAADGVPGAGVPTGPAPGAPVGTPGAVVATTPLVVHVDGAVARPGVVTVPAGSRVGDAVAAAGGVTDEADTRLVNLARPLADGELVVVPRPGEQGTGPTGAGPVPGPGGPPAGPGEGEAGPLDLNAADAAALDALPGIGPVLAERIVAHRDEVGPYTSVDDLEQVPGIGPAVLEDVRDQVTAGPP